MPSRKCHPSSFCWLRFSKNAIIRRAIEIKLRCGDCAERSSPLTHIYASPIVLIRSEAWFSVIRSNSLKISLSSEINFVADISWDIFVNPTKSVNITEIFSKLRGSEKPFSFRSLITYLGRIFASNASDFLRSRLICAVRFRIWLSKLFT